LAYPEIQKIKFTACSGVIMDRILSVGLLQDLLKARNETLKGAGFEVSSCAGSAHAKWLFRKHGHKVVVIGHGVPKAERNQLAAYVKRISPQTQVVFLYLGRAEQAQLADAIVNVEEGPAYLVQTVQYLLRKPGLGSEPSTGTGPLQLSPSARLLCIATTENALVLRKKSLLEAGFEVTGVTNLKELEAACHAHTFDLVIVGPQIGPRMKMTIADLLQNQCPSVPILEMGRATPEIQGAACMIGDLPVELIHAVRLVLHRENREDLDARTSTEA
jgi:DNA-binding NtrC family response regulator